MDIAVPEYSELRLLTTLVGYPIEEAMVLAAHLVDGASYHGDECDLERTLKLISELLSLPLEEKYITELHYFAANTWHGLRLKRSHTLASQWQWRQPEMEQELLCLRKARTSKGFESLQAVRQTQILTNTGNILSTIGRFLEAIRLYDDALIVFPSFGMALVNRGISLKTIAGALYDSGNASLLLHRAWHDFNTAPLSHLEPGVEDSLEHHKKDIELWLNMEFLNELKPLPIESLGDSESEQHYRRWALHEQLFLSPLIVLGPNIDSTRDTISLPNMVFSIDEGPGLIGMFSQIKQEFVSARLVAWEGICTDQTHFADRNTYIVDTYDYAIYGIGVEKIKIAFRMAYSILDKCAFLLNKYMSLGIPDNIVNLNRVWFVDGNPKKGLNKNIVDTDNWPLRGLFWLARDLFDKEAFAYSIEPDACEIKEIRDHIEHKYLKVHDIALPSENTPKGIRDQYAKSIMLNSIVKNTLTLLRLARSALIYLSLGIHAEERKRALHRELGSIIPAMHLDTVPDDWKR